MASPARPPLELLRELYRHMEWADSRVWEVVLGLEETIADEQLRTTLHHLHETQRAFLHVWRGLPLDYGESGEFASFPELYAWALPYYGDVGRFLATLDEARLAESYDLPWSTYFEQSMGRAPEPTTLGETLLQVPIHTTHHRAQVNTRLREIGTEPPLVDYIVWAWLGKPEASWGGANLQEEEAL